MKFLMITTKTQPIQKTQIQKLKNNLIPLVCEESTVLSQLHLHDKPTNNIFPNINTLYPNINLYWEEIYLIIFVFIYINCFLSIIDIYNNLFISMQNNLDFSLNIYKIE